MTTESYTPDNLLAGSNDNYAALPIVVASGSGVLARGTVLGKITASGKYKLVNSANTDGSQTADVILTETIDATSADITTSGYVQGEFDQNALTFGGTDTADTHRATLRSKGIILRNSVKAQAV